MAPTSKMLTASASITLIYGSLDNTAARGGKVSWMLWEWVCSRFSTKQINSMWVWEDLFFVCFLGIYFAKHATYADKYSTSSTDLLPVFGNETQHLLREGTKILFLARVVTGKSNRGMAHFRKPDHGTSVNTHYSCVDDTEHPKIFVIFDPN